MNKIGHDDIGGLSIGNGWLVGGRIILLNVAIKLVSGDDACERTRFSQGSGVLNLVKLPFIDLGSRGHLYESDDQLLASHFNCQFVADHFAVDIARNRLNIKILDRGRKAYLVWNDEFELVAIQNGYPRIDRESVGILFTINFALRSDCETLHLRQFCHFSGLIKS